MIEKLYAKNYGCLKDVETPQLGMLHAFIGPNDSGKSTLLRAVRLLTYCANSVVHQGIIESSFELKPKLEQQWVGAITPVGGFEIASKEGQLYEGNSAFDSATVRQVRELRWRKWDTTPGASPALREQLRWARLLRLDPDALRMRSTLLPDGAEVTFGDDRGRGLPGVYDNIVNRGDDSFAEIRDRVTKLFPSVKSVRLRTMTQSEKELEIELRDGTKVGASQMSEGLLYFLAFAALPYLSPTSMVLVEEPENGLHPARIAEVMTTLREFSKTGTQVIIATHSPLVVNELAGDEVSVVTRSEAGTKLTLMKDTPNFAERSKVYALGELWVSYANGVDEAPLMNPTSAK